MDIALNSSKVKGILIRKFTKTIELNTMFNQSIKK